MALEASKISPLSVVVTGSRNVDDVKPYTVYVILVKWAAAEWTVSRRYHEFADLHTLVYAKHGGCPLRHVSSTSFTRVSVFVVLPDI